MGKDYNNSIHWGPENMGINRLSNISVRWLCRAEPMSDEHIHLVMNTGSMHVAQVVFQISKQERLSKYQLFFYPVVGVLTITDCVAYIV